MYCTLKTQAIPVLPITQPLDREKIENWSKSVNIDFYLKFFLNKDTLLVHTADGTKYANEGDYLVKETDGLKLYKKDHFDQIYDLMQ